MWIKADLHVHTNLSKDGVHALPALVAQAKARGIDVLAVCDHNRWMERACLPGCEEFGVLVLPGCEFSTNEGHVLGIFFDWNAPMGEILPPKAGVCDCAEVARAIRERGGICILAHPFEHGACEITDFSLFDGVEVFNARAAFKNKKANEQAGELATQRALLGFASSDAHTRWEIGNAYTEVEVDTLSPWAVKAALLGEERRVYGKKGPAVLKGISQGVQRWRKNGLRSLPKSVLYFGYCVMKDILGR